MESTRSINSSYFQRLLDNSNLSANTKQFVQKVIDTVKKKSDQGTNQQYAFLKRLETGNFKFSPKN